MNKSFYAVIFIIILIIASVFYLQFFFLAEKNAQVKNQSLVERLPFRAALIKKITSVSAPPASPQERPMQTYHHAIYDEESNTVDRSAYHETVPSSVPHPTYHALAAVPPPAHEAAAAHSPVAEELLKYVLFTVKYTPTMNAESTETLILTMSPRNALANLKKVLADKQIQQNQINEIEKLQNQYKYVSAELVTQHNCLSIQKKMPAEDKVYLPSINETSADQIWEWDLIAPKKPAEKYCVLSLFIRYCANQYDYLPMENPDKEFKIYINIALTHFIYSWLNEFGNLSSAIISIITIIGIIAGLIWRREQSRKK